MPAVDVEELDRPPSTIKLGSVGDPVDMKIINFAILEPPGLASRLDTGRLSPYPSQL